jgi:hypothetical protein
MPRYFFHVRDRDGSIEDKKGVEIPDFEAALSECRRVIREVLSEHEWGGEVCPHREFHIVDELGQTILVVPFLGASDA